MITGVNKMAAYKRQFYPGTTTPAKNRRRYMDPKVKLKKLRDVAMDDVVRIMGHRNPGEDYKSCLLYTSPSPRD